MWHHFSLASVLLPSICIASAARIRTSSSCQNVVFTVEGTAQNLNLTGINDNTILSLQEILGAAQTAGAMTVSGPQTLAGTYCTPATQNPNNARLQVFFASITANRGSWSAFGDLGDGTQAYQPSNYSWVDFALAKGYATLAIDRLGTGESAHPDPVLVVQAPYEMALYANLAQQLRSGTNSQIPKYSYLIYVGNSYGSQLGASIPGLYPGAYDDFILTGFSKNVQQDFIGVDLTMPAPAAIVDPAKFARLPVGYVTTSSQVGRTNSFFGSPAQVFFDRTVANLFFQYKDVVSLGQFIDIYALTYQSPSYTGRVLVLTGEQDQAFCGPGSPVIGPAGCGPLLQQTGSLFPKANYNWKSINRTGHAIQFHESAQTVFTIAHEYLAGQSFHGGPPA